MTTALDRLEFEADRIQKEQDEQMDLSGLDFDDDFDQAPVAGKGRNFVVAGASRDAKMAATSGRLVENFLKYQK